MTEPGSDCESFAQQFETAWKRELFLRGLIEQERRILDRWGNCECSQAPLCPHFRRPGELFENGLPESVVLP